MQKKNKSRSRRNDFDDIFKSLKTNHTELFISIINESFGTHYTRADKAVLLSTEGVHVTGNGHEQSGIVKRYSDFLLKIGGKTYLIECQSYEDDTMAIRIAEYAFFSAKNNATWEDGRLLIDMPNFVIIYVRSNRKTSRRTEITFSFPNGEKVRYDCKNIFLSDYSREDIVSRSLYAFIPYYIMRYEADIKAENAELMLQIEEDIRYFLREMGEALTRGELSVYDVANLKEYMKIIIRHIAGGSQVEERLVDTMGGTVIVTEADKLVNKGMRAGLRKGRIEGRAEGIDHGIEVMKELGIPLEIIAEKMNVPIERVRTVK